MAWNLMGLMNNSQYEVKIQRLTPDSSVNAGKQTAHLRFMHPVNGGMAHGGWMLENVPHLQVSMQWDSVGMALRADIIFSALTISDGHLKNYSHSLAQLSVCTVIR